MNETNAHLAVSSVVDLSVCQKLIDFSPCFIVCCSELDVADAATSNSEQQTMKHGETSFYLLLMDQTSITGQLLISDAFLTKNTRVSYLNLN